MSDAFWIGFWGFMIITSGGIVSVIIILKVLKEVEK